MKNLGICAAIALVLQKNQYSRYFAALRMTCLLSQNIVEQIPHYYNANRDNPNEDQDHLEL
jgi:hypothetical protein